MNTFIGFYQFGKAITTLSSIIISETTPRYTTSVLTKFFKTSKILQPCRQYYVGKKIILMIQTTKTMIITTPPQLPCLEACVVTDEKCGYAEIHSVPLSHDQGCCFCMPSMKGSTNSLSAF